MFHKAIVVLLACSFPVASFTQTPSGTSTGNTPIRLNVVVTPSSGTPVADLPQTAFTVLDNGRPQPLTSFRVVSGKSDPVKVLIVIDAVNIGYTQLAFARQQIQAFLRSNDGQLAFPTSLAVITDTSAEILPRFTSNGNELSQTLDQKSIGLRSLPRNSGFYGAQERLQISLTALQKILVQAKGIPGRKLVLWVSPGWPFLSGPSVELSRRTQEQIFRQVVTFSTLIREANVTLYSVNPLGAGEGPGRVFYYEEFVKGVRKPSDVLLGNLGLQVLAIQSGGGSLNGSNDVRSLLQKCVDEAKAFYQLAYTPPPPDAPDEYHHIEVRVAEPHLTARTLSGYYSQPQP